MGIGQLSEPQLFRGRNSLTLAPPPNLDPRWWGPHTTYTLAKTGMIFVTLGLAAGLRDAGIAVNPLWPRTVIATDALKTIPGVASRAAASQRLSPAQRTRFW